MSEFPPDRRARIAAAFGRADAYDAGALVQRDVAAALAQRIAARGIAPDSRILELGCGTGFLTRALAARAGAARWTISDLAPAMVERARASGIAGDYRVIDGEAVDPALAPFDLIASSMAFQWFADLGGAIARLAAMLGEGGLLAFSTMAEDNFPEWRAALAAEGLSSGTPAYPDTVALAALAPASASVSVEIVDFPQAQTEARGFLAQLKAIGAGTPAPGYRPLPPAALRRAMARFDAGPRIVTYRIAFCLIEEA